MGDGGMKRLGGWENMGVYKVGVGSGEDMKEREMQGIRTIE